jgi:pre-mRNA 3'-end-processing factor FIP1
VKPAIKKESTPKGSLPISGADLPAIATSKIDVDAKPIYEPAGKPITQVVIDDDLTENDKPWRRPGTDVSDYFNYGFDEFTWALYAAKQEALRSEFDPEKISQNQKKMMEDMNMMMTMGGFSGMPGMPTASGAPGASMPGMPAMPGMDGMLPDFQAMMQQMMASGVDMSQMDPATFASMAGGQDGMGGQGGAQGASGAAGFGGQQGYGQAGNQQGMGFGYDNSSNRGRGRGRGHRNW